MKKLIAIALVALVGSSLANAKVVRSRTVGEKEKAPTEWIIRVGASINNAAGAGVSKVKEDEDEGYSSVGSRAGMDLSIAFHKPLGTSGAYWGMELGFGSRGASASATDETGRMVNHEWIEGTDTYNSHISTWNANFSPFTIGYKYALNSDIKLDGHLGAFVSYDFAGSAVVNCTSWDGETTDTYEDGNYGLGDESLDGFQRFDAGMQIGVGVWYKKFNFDITYQRGFVRAYSYEFDGDMYDIFSSNLMLRVGYSF
jgi:hypothetical protein